MAEIDDLLERLRKIEALFAGATSLGERAAAAAAAARVAERLGQAEREEVIEWRFSLPDPWKRRLFLALCRKHGLEPYRYYRQRRGTLMVRATKDQVDRQLWPEFEQFSEQLGQHLDEVTTRVMREVLRQEDREEAVRPELG
jgi:hypothetical protein